MYACMPVARYLSVCIPLFAWCCFMYVRMYVCMYVCEKDLSICVPLSHGAALCMYVCMYVRRYLSVCVPLSHGAALRMYVCM